jgi:hypothetical protein
MALVLNQRPPLMAASIQRKFPGISLNAFVNASRNWKRIVLIHHFLEGCFRRKLNDDHVMELNKKALFRLISPVEYDPGCVTVFLSFKASATALARVAIGSKHLTPSPSA